MTTKKTIMVSEATHAELAALLELVQEHGAALFPESAQAACPGEPPDLGRVAAMSFRLAHDVLRERAAKRPPSR